MLYFAYGMNCHPREMARRCPDSVYLGRARAPGYRLDFNLHCDITADGASEVYGALWSITDACLANLDLLEGYPDYYVRKQILVWPEHEDQSRIATTYEMVPENKVALAPNTSYWSMVSDAYEQLGLPDRQLTEALDRTNQLCQQYSPAY